MTVTVNSPWRELGKVSYDQWMNELWTVASPITDEGRDAYNAAGAHSALCLGMLWVESKHATAFNRNVPANLNPLNLRPPGQDGYMSFRSYADGIRAWVERITSPTYRDGIYARTGTIRELVGVYAPGFDNNNPDEYAQHIVNRHRAIFGVKENAADDTSGGASQGDVSNVTKPTVLLIAGHRSHGDAGNPVEKDMTDDLARAYRDAFRAAGYDVTWLQEADGDNDPDDTVGGLDTVSRKAGEWCARQENGILLDLHFEGTSPQVRGVFAIIPDVTGLTTGAPVAQHPQDTWDFNARDRRLGRALTDGISVVTGLPIRQGLRAPGLMDESQTGVGGQGYRLATFAYTSPWCPKVVRLVVEHGAHTNPQDLAIIRSPGFYTKCALAAVAAVNEVYDVDAVPTPPPDPQPSPIWWEPGDDWGPQTRTHDGAIAWAFLGEVRAKRDVPLRKDAHTKAEVVHRLKAGDAMRIVGTYKAANKVVWAFIEYAPGKVGRAPLSAFNPYRWPTV